MRAYNKGVKRRSYTLGKKILLNNKYIKIKQNKKLEKKFFGLFQVFYRVGKQAYTLKLSTKWKIYNVFHLLLLEQNIIRKDQVNKLGNDLLEPKKEVEVGDNKEYEVEAVIDSVVYSQETNDQMPGFYSFISWKGYPKVENI